MNAPSKGRRGPGASWRDRYHGDCRDYGWYELAQQFRREGVTGDVIFELVSDFYRGAGPLSGAPSTIRKAIERVRKRLRSEPGRYYRSPYLRDQGIPLAKGGHSKGDVQRDVDRINALLQKNRERIKVNRAGAARRGAVRRGLSKKPS